MSEVHDGETLRAVLGSLQTGVFFVDRKRKIVLWSEGAERITGYLRHEVLGRHCRDNILIHCNDKGCALCGNQCPLTLALEDGKATEVRAYVRHKAGHEVAVHLWAVPVRDERGAVLGAAGNFVENRIVCEPDRRRSNLAAHGCLDMATGLPNHAFSQSQLRQTLAIFAEHRIPFSILCIQIEHLEQVRATYGQDAIGAVLREAGETMRNSLRPSDFLGRWREDEFLAILTNCGKKGMEFVSERIHKIVASMGILWWGKELSVNVCIGTATAQVDETPESILARAESGLPGKRGGNAAGTAAGHGN